MSGIITCRQASVLASLCQMGTQLSLHKGAQPPSNFGPISVAAKWLYGSRCHLVWRQASSQGTLCYRWGSSPLNFWPMFIIVIVIQLEHCTMHSRYWFVQVQVQVRVFVYAFYFQEKSLIVLSLFRYAQLHHTAPIAKVGVANQSRFTQRIL